MNPTRLRKGVLALGIGLFLTIPLWSFVVAPKLLELPADFSFAAEVVSVDNFYDEERGVYTGGVFSKTNYVYFATGEKDGALIVKNIFDVRTSDGEPVFSTERLYGINRKTGAHVASSGDKNRDGYLFAPRNLKKGESYTYWHVNYDGPAQMTFVGEEGILGLKTFHFETSYEGVPIDQTVDLGFLPGVGETRGVALDPHLEVWVEPLTGRLIKYQDETTAYYYDLETGEWLHPWNKFSNTFHERSVRDNVAVVQHARVKALAVEWYAPIIIALFALFFVFRGFSMWPIFRKHLNLQRIRIITGASIASIAATTLVGWLVGSETLTRIVPAANAMNPTTSLCFILIGTAFLLHTKKKLRFALILAGITSVIGGLRLLGSVGVIPIQVDLIFLREVVLGTELPVRMADYTALSFLLLGVVPLVARVGVLNRIRIPEIFALLVSLFALIALLAFTLGNYLSAIPEFFFAAVHTAFLFFIGGSFSYAYFRNRGEYEISTWGWISISGVLLLSILTSIAFASLFDALLTRDARAQFDTEVTRTTEDIVDRIDVYTSVLTGARGLLSASKSVERNEWREYITALEIQLRYPGIQGVGYSVLVTPEEKKSHEARVQSEGFSDYQIYPEGERSLYSTIIYIEPFDIRNQKAFGYDMFSHDIRRAAMEQARDTNEPRMSGLVTLVQEIDEDVQPGFLIYVPFYGNEFEPRTLEERREHIVGYVYSPFRARNFVEGVIGNERMRHIGLRINDGTNDNLESTLYDDMNKKLTPDKEPRFSDSKVEYLAGRPVQLYFASTYDYGETIFSRSVMLISILVGVFVSVLVASLFYTFASSRQRAVMYAERMTKDLVGAKEKVDVALMKAREAEKRAQERQKSAEQKTQEAERLNKIMVGRELKMSQMKDEINNFKKELADKNTKQS